MKTSPLCNVGAVLAGGAVGGALLSLEWTLAVFVEALLRGASPRELALLMVMPLLVGFYALPGFILAMGVLGWPVWALLHAIGFRSQRVAIVAGATGALIASIVLMAGLNGWSMIGLIWLVLPGAAASWTVWRLAYRQAVRPPPARPS
ncbi:hypothetical protein [Brevundimonas sp.]|uniref:hypothetical protein n=1 Tax=Brevundimonas sp. TaxID=1871086 RepID=UPI003D6C7311